MRTDFIKISFVFVATLFLITGCATTRAHRPDRTEELNQQVVQMQGELQAKDQEIQDLRAQLDSYDRSLNSTYSKSSSSLASSSIIRVAGLSVTELQRALSRAGFDPGPIDGRIGKRTKAAVKEFQRRNNLKADGIVGERTWSLLRS